MMNIDNIYKQILQIIIVIMLFCCSFIMFSNLS